MATHQDWMHSNHAGLFEQVVQTWNYIIAPGNRERMGLASGTPQGAWFDSAFTSAFTASTRLTWPGRIRRNVLVGTHGRASLQVGIKN